MQRTMKPVNPPTTVPRMRSAAVLATLRAQQDV